MEIRYLLDTNIASCIIEGNSPAVDRRLGESCDGTDRHICGN